MSASRADNSGEADKNSLPRRSPINPLLAEALRLAKAGISPLAVKLDKKPVGSWSANQQRIDDPQTIKRLFALPEATGVAAVCGAVSGGLLCIDFDADADGVAREPYDVNEFVERWKERISAVIDPGLIPMQRTGGGGYQFFVRCSENGSNAKLACVPANNKQGFITVIETRAEGGYALLPPSQHPSGGIYEWQHLDLAHVPTLTQEQVDALLEAARALGRMPLSKAEQTRLTASYKARSASEAQDKGDKNEIIKAFNEKYRPVALLERNGYRLVGDKYLSPDSTSGNPGVTVFQDALLVYSHHGDALGDGHAHAAFDVFAILEHGGDKKAAYEAAARELGLWQDAGRALISKKPDLPQKEKKNSPTLNRCLRLARAATPVNVARAKRLIFPRMFDAGLSATEIEAVLKQLRDSAGIGYLAFKKDWQDFKHDKLQQERDTRRGRQSNDAAGIYRVVNGAVNREKDTPDGAVIVPLCNFSAYITREEIRDDGVEKTAAFEIEGSLHNGAKLPTISVVAGNFPPLNWVTANWGTRPVVYAGASTKDHLRVAIQLLSGEVPSRTVYTHLGGREIDGRWCFLNKGGALGADGTLSHIQVEPPQGLELYHLPEPPEGEALASAVRASLALLDIAPDRVTVPLLGATYRAPLGDADFSLHLTGATGAGKSELSALFSQHYGLGLDARHLPGSWSSTANSLEGLLFAGKDVLLVIDDFAPSGSIHDVARYHAAAERVVRAQGNKSGRGRSRADGSLRPPKPPRGLLLSTGEDIPRGQSIRARTVILELELEALDWKQVTEAQTKAANGVYASAMSGFIRLLASDYPKHKADFKERYLQYRDAAQSDTQHKRTSDEGAQLLATLDLFLSFALLVGAITEVEHEQFGKRCQDGMLEALAPQGEHQAASDPAERFVELLSPLFSSGRAYVADGKDEYPKQDAESWGWNSQANGAWEAQGVRIGWIDGDDLYLEPEATYAELQRFARDQGAAIAVTDRTLWKRLDERGLLVSREKPRFTVRRRGLLGAERVHVLHLSATALINSPPTPLKSVPTVPTVPASVPDGVNGSKSWVQSKNGVYPENKSVPSKSAVGTVGVYPENKSVPTESVSETGVGTVGTVGTLTTDRVEEFISGERAIPKEFESLFEQVSRGELDGQSLQLTEVKIPDLGHFLRLAKATLAATPPKTGVFITTLGRVEKIAAALKQNDTNGARQKRSI